jgi:hypothetical protein
MLTIFNENGGKVGANSSHSNNSYHLNITSCREMHLFPARGYTKIGHSNFTRYNLASGSLGILESIQKFEKTKSDFGPEIHLP